MPENGKLEEPDWIVYTPTRENKRLPIVGNLTFLFFSRVAATHYKLELRPVLNSHGLAEQALRILCPIQKKWRHRTGLFIPPHAKNERLPIVGNFNFLSPE